VQEISSEIIINFTAGGTETPPGLPAHGLENAPPPGCIGTRSLRLVRSIYKLKLIINVGQLIGALVNTLAMIVTHGAQARISSLHAYNVMYVGQAMHSEIIYGIIGIASCHHCHTHDRLSDCQSS